MARITDQNGVPIAGARLCVWAQPVNQHNPMKSVADIGRAWERGKLPMHGWFFTSNNNGVLRCTGIPTGHEVVDSYTPGGTVITGDVGTRSVWVFDRGHWGRHVVYGGGETVAYLPSSERVHWKNGDWLAITITAPGFQPYHFAFHADSHNGDLGTIQLLPVQ